MRPLFTAVPLVGLLVAGPAGADSVTDQIDQGKRLYEQGDVGGAVAELEFAVQELKGKQSAAYLATFPAPAAGWTLEEASGDDAANVPFLGNTAKRTYRAQSGAGVIEAQLMTGGSFMQGIASMFMNPQVMAGQPNAKRVRVGRDNAVVTYDPAERSGQLMLDVGGKITIVVDGRDIASGDPRVELINRWDVKKVREVAGL